MKHRHSDEWMADARDRPPHEHEVAVLDGTPADLDQLGYEAAFPPLQLSDWPEARGEHDAA